MSRRRTTLVLLALGVATLDLLPLALILKQAFTPERESFAWPPTWWPHEFTLDNFRTLGTTIELERGFWLSLGVAGLTVTSALILTLPAAWLAARRPRADRPLDAAMIVARLFPTIALAVPLAALFVSVGLYNHPAGLGLWLAHTLLAIPVAFLVLRTGFRDVPAELEDAARLDGASACGAFLWVTLPLVRPSLAAAGILVFLVSWDEFAYALLLQVTNRSLPPLLYYLSAFGYPGLASAVAAIMLVPALAIIFVLEPALRSGTLSGSGR
ncbi:MAG: carbohydrate transporter rane protein 2, family [Deltaproteobacteria bacterium]|jgi:multiple sugar transport system permease protein|nr:carbohydrate transporter rane protein 2, family [Deltaproteobacteria bacterium]